MRLFWFVVIGVFFGVVMTKSEAVSWFRIQEMFRFESFHMYGIIGVSVVLGTLLHLAIRNGWLKNYKGEALSVPDKPKQYKAALFGGIIFGLGWALTGACPGPIYVLIGNGIPGYVLVLAGALAGTILYGLLRGKLPH